MIGRAIIPLALGIAVLPLSLAQTDVPSIGGSDWRRGGERSGPGAPGARSREAGRTVLSENLRVRAVFSFRLLNFHDFRRNGDGEVHSSRISASENRSGTEVFVEELGEVLGPGEVPTAVAEISGNGVAQQGPHPPGRASPRPHNLTSTVVWFSERPRRSSRLFRARAAELCSLRACGWR